MAIITRDAWGARAPKNPPTPLNPQNVTTTYIHHGASPVTSGIKAGIQAVKSYQDFHMDGRGWNDIAYNWLVDQDGNIYEGRGWLVQGAATLNHNSMSQAICWIGNTEQPSDAALTAIAQLIYEAEHYVGHALIVQPHSAATQTTCPGDILRAWLAAGRPVNGTRPTETVPAPDPGPAPAQPPALPVNPEVRLGNTGAPVEHVQQRLNAHSVNDARLAVTVDGSFGKATENAVKAFQGDVGLRQDGIVGPQTAAALDTVPAQRQAPAPAPAPAPAAAAPFPGTTMRGAKGEAVTEIQQGLNRKGYRVAVDGDFGLVTQAAVRGFQKANGFKTDGIVGPITWKALMA